MIIFATIVFLASLAGITLLFTVKWWELKHARIIAFELRRIADLRADQLKDLTIAARVDLAKVPPEAMRIVRIAIHEAALGFAALARMAETQSHRLADLASHKHRFEKRETHSEFLRKVAEHKNGNGSSEKLDTTL